MFLNLNGDCGFCFFLSPSSSFLTLKGGVVRLGPQGLIMTLAGARRGAWWLRFFFKKIGLPACFLLAAATAGVIHFF